MDFDSIFSAFYTLYRAEKDTPLSTDDEFTIGMRFANEALSRWASYDGTFWKELFDTCLSDGTGDHLVITGVTDYDAPVNFKLAGGSVRIKDSNNNTVRHYPIVEPQDVQFNGDDSTIAYFTRNPTFYSAGTVSQSDTTITGVATTFTSAMVGKQIVFHTGESATITAFVSPTELTASVSQTVASTTYRILSNGYLLHLNPAPDSSINGMSIDYDYYKKPTEYTAGDTISEIPNPYFIVHRMLGNRFRASRNPYYKSAIDDAEEALKIMQLENNSGSWANPWQVVDNSGSEWGR